MTGRPLRIGLFVMMFPQVSETFIVTKLLKLLDAGFDVHVFSMKESPHWSAFDVLAGRDDVRARIHVIPPLAPLPRFLTRSAAALLRTAALNPRSFVRYVAHNWRMRHETTMDFWKLLYARSHFIGYELDILHVEFDAQAIGIADLRDFLGCHVLYSARGTFQQLSVGDGRADVRDYLFRYVDGYHFISHFLDDNTHRLGLPLEVPTWHIEPAIDLDLFRPPLSRSREAGAPLKIISVGRLSWEKGHELALDAIARVRAAGVPVDFTIYGSGPQEEAIRFAIRQLGLEDCARLGGALRREQMPAVYAAADVMVHAAIAEGFCNAVIEAQAMELPVVCSDAGGLPENVDNEVTGFVVSRRDTDAMASRVLELARDPQLRHRLGAAGRRRALARFDLDRQAEAFVRLYTELAALPRRSVARPPRPRFA